MKRSLWVSTVPLWWTALGKRVPLVLMTTLFGLTRLVSRLTTVLAGLFVPITTTVACGPPSDVMNLLTAPVGKNLFLSLRLATSPLACEQRWPNIVIPPLRWVRPWVRSVFTVVSLMILMPVLVATSPFLDEDRAPPAISARRMSHAGGACPIAGTETLLCWLRSVLHDVVAGRLVG